MIKPPQKSLKYRVLRASGKHSHTPGGWCTPTPRGQKLLHSGPYQTSPYIPHRAVYLRPLSHPLLHNKPVSISKCPPSSVSYYSQLSNLREGGVVDINLDPSQTQVWVTWGPWGHTTHKGTWNKGSLVWRSPWPVGFDPDSKWCQNWTEPEDTQLVSENWSGQEKEPRTCGTGSVQRETSSSEHPKRLLFGALVKNWFRGNSCGFSLTCSPTKP